MRNTQKYLQAATKFSCPEPARLVPEGAVVVPLVSGQILDERWFGLLLRVDGFLEMLGGNHALRSVLPH